MLLGGCSDSTRLEGTESADEGDDIGRLFIVAATRPAWRVLKDPFITILANWELVLQRLDPLGGY